MEEQTFTVRLVCYRKRSDSKFDVLVVHDVGGKRKPVAWGLPGGGVDDGESFKEALLREVEEETLLEVPIDSLVERGRSLARGSESHWNVFFGIVEWDPSMGEIGTGKDSDIDKVKWAPSEGLFEAYASIRNGRIPIPLGEDDYYPTHLAAACGIFPEVEEK